MFIDKIDMDYYVYRIGKTASKNDTIISFSLDKEGDYIDIIEKKVIKWFDFYSNPPKNVTIKRKKNSIIWELFYDDIHIYKFIDEKDIKESGYPILFYKQPL